MEIALLIVSLALFLFWTMKIDIVDTYSPIVSVSALGTKSFKYGMVFLGIATLFLMSMGWLPSISFLPFSPISNSYLLIACVSTFLCMLITSLIDKHSSVAYSLMASLIGVQYYLDGVFDFNYAISVFAGWFAAPLISMLLSMGIFSLYKRSTDKTNIHLFDRTHHLKYLILACAITLIIAFAINNGSLILFISSTLKVKWGFAIITGVIIVLCAAMGRIVIRRAYRLTEWEFDISFMSAVSIMFSSSAVLLLFSFEKIPPIIGLVATPVSLPSLLLFSMVGIGISQKKTMIERKFILNNLISTLLTPIISIALSYLLCMFVKIDFYLMFFLCLAFVGLITILIISYRERMKSKARRASFSNRQLMYEDQNELNALEIKTVIAENQSLHYRLDEKRKELINVALNVSRQKDFVEDLYEKVGEITRMKDGKEKDVKLNEIKQYLFQRMSISNEMDGFYTEAEKLHKDFSIKLTEKFPNLTETEKKLATLLRLGFSTKEISTLMNISVKSGEISRYRLRKKLNLSREDNLIKYIKSI